MKKYVIILFSFLISFMLISCEKKVNNCEKVVEELKNIDSYSCDVQIEIRNDRQKLNYVGKEYYIKNLGYRFELGEDRIFVYKDNNIYIRDLKSGTDYSTSNDFDEVFKLSFIDEVIGLMYTNEEIKYSSKKIDEDEYVIINLKIPGNNRNITYLELYIDAKGNTPKYLKVYDKRKNEKVLIAYNNFSKNIEINEKLMNVDTK